MRFQIVLSADLVTRINAWRIKHAPLEPRAEAIRKLLKRALESDGDEGE